MSPASSPPIATSSSPTGCSRRPPSSFSLSLARGWPLDSHWLLASIALYVFVGACWLPVVWLQIKMARMAEEALATKTELPERYRLYFRWWFALCWPAFIAMIGIFWLMVAKPQF